MQIRWGGGHFVDCIQRLTWYLLVLTTCFFSFLLYIDFHSSIKNSLMSRVYSGEVQFNVIMVKWYQDSGPRVRQTLCMWYQTLQPVGRSVIWNSLKKRDNQNKKIFYFTIIKITIKVHHKSQPSVRHKSIKM